LAKNLDIPQNEHKKIISIIGWGNYRTDLYKGNISQLDIENMFPFKSYFATTEVSGF
jgi:hypothetical protein